MTTKALQGRLVRHQCGYQIMDFEVGGGSLFAMLEEFEGHAVKITIETHDRSSRLSAARPEGGTEPV